jgi:glycosyltransferase involved in cell wall biosynthesis
MTRPLRILTWHVHGNYLYNLTQVPHEWWVVADDARSPHRAGRAGQLPFGDNVHEAHVDRVASLPFDVVLFQSRKEWDDDRHRLLSPAQRALPCIYLEHDPPQEHPTNTRHWAGDMPNVLLVHVTPFNALMWDGGAAATCVIEHGVKPLAPDVRWHGAEPRGIVVVNHIARRGRRLGYDVWREAAARVPLTLVGMGSAEAGGAGEVEQASLPGVMAAHRFFFNPIRYTSLGLALVEAMLLGMPIVALATTEVASVIRDGDNGIIDTRLDRLIDAMRRLLADRVQAARLGAAARATALERFDIRRFVADWERALQRVAGARQPTVTRSRPVSFER